MIDEEIVVKSIILIITIMLLDNYNTPNKNNNYCYYYINTFKKQKSLKGKNKTIGLISGTNRSRIRKVNQLSKND